MTPQFLLLTMLFFVFVHGSTECATDSCDTADLSHHNDFIQEEFGRQASSFYQASKTFKSDNLTPLIDAANVQPTDIVLDIGCGPGIITTEIAKRNPQKVIGIDLTKEMLEIAQKHAIDNGLNTNNKNKIEFIQGNVEKLPFESNTFDIVVTRWTFHHFEKLNQVIKEIHRVLKPRTGKLVFLEFCAPNNTDSNPNGIEKVFNALHTIRDPSHTWAYDENGWIDQIIKGGFDINNIEIVNRLTTEMSWMEFIEWTNPSDNDIRARKSIYSIAEYVVNANVDMGMNFHYDDQDTEKNKLMFISQYIIVQATKD